MGKAPKSDKHKYGVQPKQVYISRNKALDYLQLPLSRFRELCILKGVAPTVPPKKGYNNATTYYYVKDIRFLASDPLISKFRQWRVFMTKLRKFHDKNEENRMKNYLKTNKPIFTYDHLVKERYPNFNAALADLDDCLQLCFLFSKLPSEMGLDPELIKRLKRLTDEFCTYVAMTNSLRKVFVSFKGIYYQAIVCNTTISWVVPFDFPQNIPVDVDFKVFKTFLMFYSTLLQFVNYKLYATMGMCPPYPIAHKTKHDHATSHILEVDTNGEQQQQQQATSAAPVKQSTEAAQKLVDDKVKQIAKKQAIVEEEDDDQEFETKEEVAQESLQTDPEAIFMEKYKQMFKGNIFWIGRESPRTALEFVIRSFGGQIAFDGPDSKYRYEDARITHAVLDRPTIPNKIETRDYIQPQWVFDCVNARIKLPMEPYRPGKKLPPHLSPFVEYEELSYVPKYAEEIRRMVSNELQAIKNSVNGNDEPEAEQETADQAIAEEEEDAEFVYQREMAAEKAGLSHTELQTTLEQEKKDREVQALVKGGSTQKSKKEIKDLEEKELKLTMASNKKKKLYKAAQDAVKQKVDEKQQLMAKRIQHELKQKEKKTTTTTTTMEEAEEDADVAAPATVEENDNFDGLIAENAADLEEEPVQQVQPNKKRKREEQSKKQSGANKRQRRQ